MISACVIAHSKSPAGKEIISLQLHYPKFIHGEFMTHRVFSRNASSSRAIPFEKFVADIENDPAVPIYWGANQPGMQAKVMIEPKKVSEALRQWHLARTYAIDKAYELYALNVHKQIVNRLLEPFYNINVLVTATEWNNFFELRDHPDAQPEIRALAIAMKEAITKSKPKLLERGEWHLPYVNDIEKSIYPLKDLIKISVARCARVSYKTHDDKEPEFTKDLILYDRLVGSVPLHASPAEHQATPDPGLPGYWDDPQLHGNLVGWIQYRKLLENNLNPSKI